MAKFTKKISNLINQQAPEFVLADHPKFLEFVKTYYKFMETAEIVVDNVELAKVVQVVHPSICLKSDLLVPSCVWRHFSSAFTTSR